MWTQNDETESKGGWSTRSPSVARPSLHSSAHLVPQGLNLLSLIPGTRTSSGGPLPVSRPRLSLSPSAGPLAFSRTSCLAPKRLHCTQSAPSHPCARRFVVVERLQPFGVIRSHRADFYLAYSATTTCTMGLCAAVSQRVIAYAHSSFSRSLTNVIQYSTCNDTLIFSATRLAICYSSKWFLPSAI
jgi:hypothetical protein